MNNFKTLLSILILLLISYTSKAISYQSSYVADTSFKQTLIVPKHASLPALGRKLSIKEKVLFFISKSLLKRKHNNSSAEKEISIERLERNVHLGFIFSLFSFIMPLLIIPALILQIKAFGHEKLLSKKSRRKLIFIEVVGYFWLVVALLFVLVTAINIALEMIYAALDDFFDQFYGIMPM